MRKGSTMSLESREKMRQAKLGSVLTEEHKRNISKSVLAKYEENPKMRIRKKHTEEHNKKISEGGKKRYEDLKEREKTSITSRMENNGNWRGGKSFEEYGKDFNKKLKAQIRARDNNQCQECNKYEDNRVHSVHHIDYNKRNNNPSNLITLCIKCHIKTNFDRENWQKQLTQKQIDRGIIQ